MITNEAKQVMLGCVQLSPCELVGRMHTKLFPNLSKLAAICLMPMSTVNCEGGLSTLLCIKTDASIQFSSKILNCLVTIAIKGPPIDEFNRMRHIRSHSIHARFKCGMGYWGRYNYNTCTYVR